MKKRKLNKKLTLNSETLRNLSGDTLGNVVGAGPKPLTESSCVISCLCTQDCTQEYTCAACTQDTCGSGAIPC